MIRLFVTVWNATVANAWQRATMMRTTRLRPRRPAMSQKPRP